MIKKKLGNTNIQVSALGFGGAPLGELFENLSDINIYEKLNRI